MFQVALASQADPWSNEIRPVMQQINPYLPEFNKIHWKNAFSLAPTNGLLALKTGIGSLSSGLLTLFKLVQLKVEWQHKSQSLLLFHYQKRLR